MAHPWCGIFKEWSIWRNRHINIFVISSAYVFVKLNWSYQAYKQPRYVFVVNYSLIDTAAMFLYAQDHIKLFCFTDYYQLTNLAIRIISIFTVVTLWNKYTEHKSLSIDWNNFVVMYRYVQSYSNLFHIWPYTIYSGHKMSNKI